MILYPESPDDEELEDQRFLDLYQEAIDLYGLIHARYIITPKGRRGVIRFGNDARKVRGQPLRNVPKGALQRPVGSPHRNERTLEAFESQGLLPFVRGCLRA